MDWNGIHITDGTGQQDRAPIAFNSDYFNVDEHSLEDLLSMGAEIAGEMKFYNLQNRVEGHWGDIFYADDHVGCEPRHS